MMIPLILSILVGQYQSAPNVITTEYLYQGQIITVTSPISQ